MKQDYNHIYETCKQHMHAYVLVEMVDGSKLDGIVTGLDDEYVYLAVPLEAHEQEMSSPEHYDHYHNRSFGYGPGAGYGPGFGYPNGYGYPGGYGGYGYPGFGPPRRFRRFVLPLAGLAALSLLPWY